MSKATEITKKIYQFGYKNKKSSIERKYPNEELSRFFGRNFFSIKSNLRKKKKILETGCGMSNNLWMISQEGFSTYGIDISEEAIKLSKKLFKKKKLKGNFKVGDFTNTNYKNNFFDCVVDVFSSCSLNKDQGEKYIKEVKRILNKKGKFFSYFPSKKSDMFRFKSKKVFDKDTVMCLKKSAYSNLPLRFMTMIQYCNLLKKNNFRVNYKEQLMRTYFSGKEKFYFLVIEASKI
jgi:ubiquinone/menaquinone biosynthesis C-methylase UbiE